MLKEEMEDATERMNEMTDELSSAQSKVLEYKGLDIVKRFDKFNNI